MPKLSKVQKKVARKRGNANSLNENSRDAQKLRRAGARTEKLERLAAARAKANEPHMQRMAFFQGATKNSIAAVGVKEMQTHVQRLYLERHNEQIAQLKRQRRPGRPSSTREDLLKHSMAAEESEYDSGFWMPDMRDGKNLELIRAWNREWTALNTFKYIRLARDGSIRESSFPPKGLS